MKFLCERCKAKYQIPDEKVAGKTVRMTCRKCEHLIEVRAAVTATSVASPPKSAGSSPTKRTPSRTASPPRGTPANRDEWFAAIDGTVIGPARIGELRRLAIAGELTEDSLVCRDETGQWQPVHTVPALLVMVREASSRHRSPARTRIATPAEGIPPATPRTTYGPSHAPLAAPPSRDYAMPVTSRLATAEKLDDAPLALEEAERHTDAALPSPERALVAPDPVAVIADPIALRAEAPAPKSIAVRQKGPPPLLGIGVILGFMSFGAVAAYVIFSPPPAPSSTEPTVQTIYVEVPVAAPTPTETEKIAATPAPTKVATHAHAKPAPTEAAAPKPIDLLPPGPTLPRSICGRRWTLAPRFPVGASRRGRSQTFNTSTSAD